MDYLKRNRIKDKIQMLLTAKENYRIRKIEIRKMRIKLSVFFLAMVGYFYVMVHL